MQFEHQMEYAINLGLNQYLQIRLYFLHSEMVIRHQSGQLC